jgi:hypothetical protein
MVRVVVAGELPREAHNAPLHLFSSQPALIEFGGRTYRRHSEQTSRLLLQLFKELQAEGLAMPFTMEDFNRQFVVDHFPELTPEQRKKALKAIPPEERLAGLTEEQIQEYLDRRSAGQSARTRKARRKK